MTLPASGPLSLLDLQNEFGGTNPIAINEYYAGGPYVGSSLTQLPVAGNPIALDMFHAISANLLSGGKFRLISAASGSTNGMQFAMSESQYVALKNGYSYSSQDDLSSVVKGTLTSLSSGGVTFGNLFPRSAVGIGSELHVLMYGTVSGSTYSIPAKTADRGKTWTATGVVRANGSYGAYCGAARGSFGVPTTVFVTTYQTGTSYYWYSTAIEDGATSSAWYQIGGSTTQSLIADACFAPNIGLSQGGDGLFVAVGQYANIYTSPTGTAWTKRYAYGPGGIITSGDFTACCYGAGKIVAVSSDGYSYISTDGITFNQAGLTGITGNISYVPALKYINGYFLLMGGQGAGCCVSSDGENWTSIIQLAIPATATHAYGLNYNPSTGKIVYCAGPVSGYDANFIVQA